MDSATTAFKPMRKLVSLQGTYHSHWARESSDSAPFDPCCQPKNGCLFVLCSGALLGGPGFGSSQRCPPPLLSPTPNSSFFFKCLFPLTSITGEHDLVYN